MLSVPLSANDLHYSRWQSGEICQMLSPGPSRCFAMWFMVSRKFSLVSMMAFSASLSLLSCSRVCLLDVSRLQGLTMRLFALVCSWHWDSLTRWRLAIVQEAVRVFLLFLSLLDWSLDVMSCVWWFLTAFEAGLLKRCWNVKVVHPFLNCFSHTPLAQFPTFCSGYTWAPSNHTNILNIDSVSCFFVHLRGCCQANAPFLPVLVCCCLCCWVSYAKLGMSMETLLDPFREIVQKGLLGGLCRRRLFRRTEWYGFLCTPQHWPHWFHTWWSSSNPETIERTRFSSLGTYWAPR